MGGVAGCQMLERRLSRESMGSAPVRWAGALPGCVYSGFVHVVFDPYLAAGAHHPSRAVGRCLAPVIVVQTFLLNANVLARDETGNDACEGVEPIDLIFVPVAAQIHAAGLSRTGNPDVDVRLPELKPFGELLEPRDDAIHLGLLLGQVVHRDGGVHAHRPASFP